ncbi:MAG: pentapeptide repeat-containing protein [Gammaproteobacteria bacterium]|nr:MAG: pentapeptide repeat-containing protein [Gammaproteobacteria bacterium]
MPNQNLPSKSNPYKHSEDYFLSFPDGSLSKTLLDFAYIDEGKWTEEILNKNIAKKIYNYPEGKFPNYYQHSFSIEEYRRFIEDESSQEIIRLWQSEIEQCISFLKNWANSHAIEIYNEHRQLVSLSSQLERFFERLKKDEFSDKTILFYADGKKAIEIITLLIQDEMIDQDFRQNQLITLMTDGNLLMCADGCLARLMETAENLRNYGDLNLPALIRRFILYLAQDNLKSKIHGVSQSYIIYLCEEEKISVVGNEIHAQNYLINRLLSALGLEALQIKDDLTRLFKKPEVDEIYYHYETDFKKNFRAQRFVQFIQQYYYQLKGMHFSDNLFYSDEAIDLNALANFLDGLGQDEDFNLNEVLQYEENTQKTTLKDDQVLSVTLAERLLKGKWFDLSVSGRWSEKFKLLTSLTQQPAYRPPDSDIDDFRLFTGNLALSWLKRKEKEMRETLLSVLSSENNPIDILQKISIQRLDYLFENREDLILFFKTLPVQERSNAIEWLKNNNFDLHAALLNQYFFISQMSISYSKIFFENLFLLQDFNYLFSDLINNRLSEFTQCCNTQQLITDLLKESTLLTRYNSQRFFSVYRNFMEIILKSGFRQFKKLTFENPQHYLYDIDFSKANFKDVIFQTPLININFNEAIFNHVNFFCNLIQIKFENSNGRIEIIGNDQSLLVKKVNFISSNLEIFANNVEFTNVDFSHYHGKIFIEGEVSQSYLVYFQGLFVFSGTMRATLLDYFSGILQINGDIVSCSFNYLKFNKFIINGKIIKSFFSNSDFRNTIFLDKLDLNAEVDSNKNLFLGDYSFVQEDNSFAFFKNSKFSTLSFTQLLSHPRLPYHSELYLFRETDMREINFQDVDLQEALKKYFLIDFTGANFAGVNFDHFSNDVCHFNFIDTDLNAASFRYANLNFFDFTKADLSFCDFSLAHIESTNVRDAKIENIKLRIDQLFQFYDQGHTEFSTLQLVGSLEQQWQDNPLNGAKLSSQAFQYLIQQGHKNFAFTDLRTVASSLLVEYYSRIDLDFELVRLPGDFSFNYCLGNSQRKRRDVCLFGWNEIDQFNEEKIDNRDINKIVIRSELFLATLTSLSAEQQEQLLEFARTYPIVGADTKPLKQLFDFSRWQFHLRKFNHVSHLVLKSFFIKDTLISFMNGNYEDTAINLGLLSSEKLLSQFASELSFYEKALELNGKKLLSQLFKIASPFILRAGSFTFLIYDLIEALQSQDDQKFLRVIDDEIFIATNAAEMIIEWSELLSPELILAMEGVTLSLGLVVFIGSNAYFTRQYVQHIDALIPLTAEEKFYEGLRLFFGRGIEASLEELIEEKQINNILVKQSLSFLKQQDQIQYFIFPTAKRVEECWFAPYLGSTYSGGGLGGGKSMGQRILKWAKFCNATYPMDLNNRIILDKKLENIRWSRTQPDSLPGAELFCFMPSCQFKSNKPWMNETYFCENALGIRDLTPKVGNYTLIDVDIGSDEVHGFLDRPNIIVAGNGTKNLRGGNLDDIFILRDYPINGTLNGLLGNNTLELKEFLLHQDLKIDLKAKALASYNNTKYMDVLSIQQILGRPNKKEGIVCVCDTRYVDGRGGEGNNGRQDIIFIPDLSCAYQLTLKVSDYTIILNRARSGNFSYWVRGGQTFIDLNSTANHQVVFNYTLIELTDIHYRFNTTSPVQSAIFCFNITKLALDSIEIEWLNQSQPSFSLPDQTQVKFDHKKIFILQKSQQTIQEILQHYLAIALRLKAILIVNTHEEYIIIGSFYNEILPNNPFYPSHLVGNEGESIYKVLIAEESNTLPRITLHYLPPHKLSIETLDLRELTNSFRNRTCTVNLTIQEQFDDLQLNIYPHRDCQLKQRILEIVLNNALKTQWYKRLNIVMDRAPLEIISMPNKTWSLIPKPLKFSKTIRILALFNQDVEAGTTIIMPTVVKSLIYARLGNNFSDLGFFPKSNGSFYGLILRQFYLDSGLSDPTLRSLWILYGTKPPIRVADIAAQSLEFIPTINQVLNTQRHEVYQSVFNAHVRKARELNWQAVASSSTRPSFWLFGNLKQIHGLLSKTKIRLQESFSIKQVKPLGIIDTHKLDSNPNNESPQTAIVIYKSKLRSIVITFSSISLLKGSLSAICEEISEHYKNTYSYLPPFVHYGIKPILLASSIDWENPASLLIYLMTHAIAMQGTEFIGQNLALKVRNKLLNFLIHFLITILVFHSYLFNNDEGIEGFISKLASHLMQACLFKTGEWVTQRTISQFFKQAPEMNNPLALNEPSQRLMLRD